MEMITHSSQPPTVSRELDPGFSALFLNYPDGIVLVDDEGGVLAANPAASRLTGRSEEELKRLGCGHLLSLVEPLGEPELPGAAGKEWFGLIRSDGVRVPVELRLVRFRDEVGTPLLSVFMSDASQSPRMGETIRREDSPGLVEQPAEGSVQHEQLLAEVTTNLVIVADYPDSLYTIVGLLAPGFADFTVIVVLEDGSALKVAFPSTGPAGDEQVPEAARDVESDGARLPHLLARILSEGRPLLLPEISGEQLEEIAVSSRHLDLMRRFRPLSALSVPLHGRDQQLGALCFLRSQQRSGFTSPDVVVAQELARRIGLAIDNARRYQHAESASRAKTEFLATISHEIRTPLTTVIGYTEFLESELLGPLVTEQKEAVQRIRLGTLHLVSLVEQLLSVSKIEAGQYALQREVCDLRKIVGEAADLIRHTLPSGRLSLHVSVPEERIEWDTDPNKLRQVLLNLLSNAVKFTPEGEIQLGLRRDGAGVLLWVQDSGIGITPEHQKRIFEPFWQVEPIGSKRDGSGLGLSIVHRLTALLGGSISVDSEPGSGTRFTVRFPRQ